MSAPRRALAEPSLRASTEQPAGWYPDPSRGSDAFRWWTGQGWADWLSSDIDADPPPESADEVRVVPPGPRRRLGTAARIAIAVAVAAGLVAAMVITGYDSRSRVVFTAPLPSVTAIPVDRTLRCGDDAFTLGRSIGVRPTDRYAIGGPTDFVLDNTVCLGRKTAEQPSGNLVYTLGEPPVDVAELAPEAMADAIVTGYEGGLYSLTGVRVADRNSGELTGIPDATGWTVTGRFVSSDEPQLDDAFEVTVIDIDGVRGVWFHVLSARLPEADRQAVLDVRAGLGRP